MASTEEFDFDAAEHVLRAMEQISSCVKHATSDHGTGSIRCPRCAGTLRFAWAKKRRGTRRLRYVATCETLDCITFSGH